ncbi:MAG: S41 family peptidase [Prevotella sp.]|jgi:carboxyl-terminal processing protease|nr:S41 family peptidase [Prevotella sp.]MCI2081161.1 S41 family peptidase [Prevotella sp.]MCI2103036.1 S41 family peptidase [Prevotella sp.]HCN53294.1 peptidase S41 [Prevotella sp.]
MNPNKTNRFMPIIMALCVVVGIIIGTFYANHFSGNRLNIINSGSNRLNSLLHIIDDQYVDNVNMDSLVEKAIPAILAELDPHSVYISAKDVQSANDDLKGSFSGVGIEFTIRQDTIHVQNVIKNGPAERAGIIAGDKIVSVDGKPFVGKIVTNEEAQHRLKGPKNSKVKIGIVRYGSKKVKYFTVTRGEIPQKTVTAAYMLNDDTGYIRVSKFGETTYPEMLVALANLSQNGFSNLVIDLRDNTGGYMQSAIQMANEFLPKNKLIVYTQGRKSPRQEFRSDGHGSYQKIPLIVLINEGSASASEIFSGAMQDNDRATIIGRRSFGKGLVQQQIPFSDGSMIRLTIARYYTPSGRCIQKPYTSGDDQAYNEDLLTRYQHGEYFSRDSIKHTGKPYYTSIGRVVYGGGGITPDIFVPEDTLGITSYYKEAAMSGLILQFAFTYTDDNRLKLNNFKEMKQMADYLEKQALVEKFATYADKHGLQRRNLLIKKSYKLLDTYINSRIIYNMLDEQAWNEYINLDDPVINTALRVFKNHAAFPKKPTPASKKKGKVAVVSMPFEYRGYHAHTHDFIYA